VRALQLRQAPEAFGEAVAGVVMARTDNLRAVNRMVKALRAEDALEDSADALVELTKALARAVDADPCPDCGTASNAALWREYRQAVTALLEAGDRDHSDDDTAEFVLSISRPSSRTAVGDSEN
jgi:hypothetical protein